MNILVTGGAGFIGSHLAETLLEQNNRVTVIDNLSTGSLDNLRHLLDQPSFNFHHADVRDTTLLDSVIDSQDLVYHLAAAVGVELIARDPVHTIETNIHGTQSILEAANKNKTAVLIASTSEVYGKSENVPFAESDDLLLGPTTCPRWAYACSKAIDEFLGLAFHQQYDLPVIITRFFNTIGPRQTGKYGMVVPRFIHNALTGKPLTIYGTGNQTRCFCYITDVIEAMLTLTKTPKAVGQVFNIGSTEEISIEALADLVIKTTNSKSKKKYIPYEKAYSRPIEDMTRRLPDITKINQTTAWTSKTTLKAAIQKIAAAQYPRSKTDPQKAPSQARG